jgi:hypothetical protein
MSAILEHYFRTLPQRSLRLTLNYQIPSLNVSLRQHWTQQQKAKKTARDALQSALSAIGYDHRRR